MSSLRLARQPLACLCFERKHIDMDSTLVVQTTPILQEGLGTPTPKFFHHVRRYPWDEIESCPANSNAMARNAWVAFLCCLKNFVDTMHKFRTGECMYVIVAIAVSGDGMISSLFLMKCLCTAWIGSKGASWRGIQTSSPRPFWVLDYNRWRLQVPFSAVDSAMWANVACRCGSNFFRSCVGGKISPLRSSDINNVDNTFVNRKKKVKGRTT